MIIFKLLKKYQGEKIQHQESGHHEEADEEEFGNKRATVEASKTLIGETLSDIVHYITPFIPCAAFEKSHH